MGFSASRMRMPACAGIDIEELSITQLQDHLKAGTFTSRELTACYLQRIEQLNPRLRAVIETNPDALNIADRSDIERHNGLVRSQIHGIPFLLKDNIATSDKMRTTAGCAALLQNEVNSDAVVVARLRAAGGVLIGKSNLSEWASVRASYYAEAYSSRGGQNRNPYNLSEHPGGSSSGSASALASNMCAFSIGTETDGSVMFPADRNAVVGIKPTVGLVPMGGVIPEAPSMDTVGTFGRSVSDAAIVLDIICGNTSTPDVHTRTTTQTPDNSLPYAACLADKHALRGVRFGLPQTRIWQSAADNSERQQSYLLLQRILKRVEDAGAQLVEVNMPSAEEIVSPKGWDWSYGNGEVHSTLSEFEVVKVEFYRSLHTYLETTTGPVRSLEDVLAYNVEHTNTEGGVPGTHPAWPTGQDTLDECVKAKNTDEQAYRQALEYIRRKSRAEGIDAALKMLGKPLDALLVPLQAEGGVACSVAAKAGYPMISVPVGIGDNHIPVGIGLMQTAGKEDVLIRYASAIEDLAEPRARPTFLNWGAKNYPYVGEAPHQ